MNGQLTRLLIEAYSDLKFKKEDRKGFIYLQVNPESYAVNYSISYSEEQVKGTSGFVKKWEKTPPKSLSFEIIFDNTGVIPVYNQNRLIGPDKKPEKVEIIPNKSVNTQIEEFEKIVFKVDGGTHAPNYLLLIWGNLIFGCRLESMNVTYKLFAPDGAPLRASVNATFVEANRDAKTIFENNFQSPDVTHAFTVKEGDSLPLMAEKVYGNGAYYIAVARANKLIQFRNLKAGSALVFPPIKKQDA